MIPVGRVPIVLAIAALDDSSQLYFRRLEQALDVRYSDHGRNTRLLALAFWLARGDTAAQAAARLGVDRRTVSRDLELLRDVVDRPAPRDNVAP